MASLALNLPRTPPLVLSASRRLVYAKKPSFPPKNPRSQFRVCSVAKQRLHDHGSLMVKASASQASSSDQNDNHEIKKIETGSLKTPFFAKLALMLGIAAAITITSGLLKWPTPGSSFEFPIVVEKLSSSVTLASTAGFSFKLFGRNIILPEYTPGWVYFWLLMAAGFGLFVSEEALNVWVGISLARKLTFDGSWSSFAQSFCSNAPYIISTVLWVYWGVCISDMVPFYLGKLFRKTKASEDICSKLGVGKDKVVSITRLVEKYGNLIGFVERFSIGIRNPTSFLAGAWGISADCFFTGVCCGGVITLSIQHILPSLLYKNQYF